MKNKYQMTTKKISLIIFALCTISIAKAQFIATVEMKQPLEGICNQKAVYALFPGFKGQVEASCSLTKKQIEEQLNKLDFLVQNPKLKTKGMIGGFINCKGEPVKWDIDMKTKSPDLDKQILEVFKALTGWAAGKLDGIDVDTHVLFSYEIKKGHLTLN